MGQRTLKEKLDAILSYCFILWFIPKLKKDKTKYLKSHLKKGGFLNMLIIIWLILIVISYRIVYILNIDISVITIVLYVMYGIIFMLVFCYQLYSIFRILRKKD